MFELDCKVKDMDLTIEALRLSNKKLEERFSKLSCENARFKMSYEEMQKSKQRADKLARCLIAIIVVLVHLKYLI